MVLDCARPLSGSARIGLREADDVLIGRGVARGVTRERRGESRVVGITLPDPHASHAHARIVATAEGHRVEDAGSRNGTKVNGTTVAHAMLRDGDIVQVGRTLLLYRKDEPAPEGYGGDLDLESAKREIRTLKPSFQAALSVLERVARSSTTVLVRGETGAGKELVAEAVHRRGRPEGPFVAVNCGAIPPGLVESQLFGHVRGAFSGAVRDEPGFVRSAANGTLFLDEIADLPRSSQAALLRVLQEREVVPVGGTRPEAVDVRVVSATHASLEALVERGDFREDLLARLKAYVFHIPPLRDRLEDVGLIVGQLLHRIAPDRARTLTFDPEAARQLFVYRWPRNVRELEQCLSVAMAVAKGPEIEVTDLPESIFALDAPSGRPNAGVEHARPREAEGAEAESSEGAAIRDQLVRELERHRGNVAATARAMGRARPLVHRWIRRFRLDPDVYRRK